MKNLTIKTKGERGEENGPKVMRQSVEFGNYTISLVNTCKGEHGVSSIGPKSQLFQIEL